MKYNLRQIEVFLAVAETLSLTRSAEQLFLTVPAVSKQLRNLESHCGGQLFKVIGKQLHLTARAQQLLPQARKVLTVARTFETVLMSKPKDTSRVRLHIGNTYQRLIFHYLAKFKKQHPQVELAIKTSNWAEQQKAMTEQRDRLFIAGEPNVSTAKFHVDALLQQNFILVVSPDHPVLQYTQPTLQHLMSYTWALSTSLSRSQLIMRDWLAGFKSRKPLLQLSSFESIQHAAEAGLTIAYLPEPIVVDAIRHKKLVKLNVAGPPPVTNLLTLTYRRDLQLNDAAIKLIQFLKDQMKP